MVRPTQTIASVRRYVTTHDRPTDSLLYIATRSLFVKNEKGRLRICFLCVSKVLPLQPNDPEREKLIYELVLYILRPDEALQAEISHQSQRRTPPQVQGEPDTSSAQDSYTKQHAERTYNRLVIPCWSRIKRLITSLSDQRAYCLKHLNVEQLNRFICIYI